MRSFFDAADIPLTPEQEVLFQKLLDAFLAYNAHTNLSAIRDPEGVIVKHFVDSAELLRFENLSGRLLDIGTGGGFPGIPLKIVANDLDVTLLDSVGKKIRACESFIAELLLTGIRGVHARAEEISTKAGYRRNFDHVVSRATAYLPQILEWGEPFLAVNGSIAIYKTPSDEEMKDGERVLRRLGLDYPVRHTYQLDGQERTILVYRRSRR